MNATATVQTPWLNSTPVLLYPDLTPAVRALSASTFGVFVRVLCERQKAGGPIALGRTGLKGFARAIGYKPREVHRAVTELVENETITLTGEGSRQQIDVPKFEVAQAPMRSQSAHETLKNPPRIEPKLSISRQPPPRRPTVTVAVEKRESFSSTETETVSPRKVAVADPDPVLTFGHRNNANKRVSQQTDPALVWYQKFVTQRIQDPTKWQFARANEAVLSAIETEIEKRKEKRLRDMPPPLPKVTSGSRPGSFRVPLLSPPPEQRNPEATKVFSQLLAELARRGMGERFMDLVGRLSPELVDGRLELHAKDPHLRDWLSDNYGPTLADLAKDLSLPAVRIAA